MPSAFGSPPYPTLSSRGSSSTILTPAIRLSSSLRTGHHRERLFDAGNIPPFLNLLPLADDTTTGLIPEQLQGALPKTRLGGRDYAGGDADFYKIDEKFSCPLFTSKMCKKLGFAAPVLCSEFVQGAWRRAVYHNFTVEFTQGQSVEHSKIRNNFGRTT